MLSSIPLKKKKNAFTQPIQVWMHCLIAFIIFMNKNDLFSIEGIKTKISTFEIMKTTIKCQIINISLLNFFKRSDRSYKQNASSSISPTAFANNCTYLVHSLSLAHFYNVESHKDNEKLQEKMCSNF